MVLTPPGVGLPVAFSKGVALYSLTSGFNPDQIEGLKAALYGTNLTGADGAEVATWPDPDAGSSFTNVVSGAGPIKKTGILSGLPVARGDGTKYLGTVLPITTSLQFTIFAVFNHTPGATGVVIQNGSIVLGDGYGLVIRNDEIPVLLEPGGDGSLTFGTAVSGWTLISVGFDGTNVFYTISGQSGGSFPANNPLAPTLGTRLFSIGNSAVFIGDIFSTLVFDNWVGTTNRTKILNYLSALTGIALGLMATFASPMGEDYTTPDRLSTYQTPFQ